MRNIIIVILCLGSLLPAVSQDISNKNYALTTLSTTVGAGSVTVLDPYLSPFNYSGIQLRTLHNTRRFFKPDNNKLSYSNHLLFEAGTGNHPSGRNSMQFFNANYMFGVNLHWRPAEKLMFLAGGSWDMDLGGKYLSRNVNNPFSLDLYTNFNATGEVQYQFNLLSRNFRIQYGVVSPLFGFMFAPLQNVTYYEIFVLNNTENAFHFSSLHNKRALNQRLNIDIPLKFNTLRISVQKEYQKYSANELVFRRNNFTLTIGTVVHLYTFKEKKDKIPTNFIHSYE